MNNLKAYIFIYLLPPLITLGFFMLITRNLKLKEDGNAPYLSIATIHLHFCLIFMLLGNSILGHWGNFEATALLYFFFISPLVCASIGFKNFLKRRENSTNYWLFTSSVNYMIIYIFSILAIVQST